MDTLYVSLQDIAVARGATYDSLNKRMDRCQASIEAISDDIQQLQGSSVCVFVCACVCVCHKLVS